MSSSEQARPSLMLGMTAEPCALAYVCAKKRNTSSSNVGVSAFSTVTFCNRFSDFNILPSTNALAVVERVLDP